MVTAIRPLSAPLVRRRRPALRARRPRAGQRPAARRERYGSLQRRLARRQLSGNRHEIVHAGVGGEVARPGGLRGRVRAHDAQEERDSGSLARRQGASGGAPCGQRGTTDLEIWSPRESSSGSARPTRLFPVPRRQAGSDKLARNDDRPLRRVGSEGRSRHAARTHRRSARISSRTPRPAAG